MRNALILGWLLTTGFCASLFVGCSDSTAGLAPISPPPPVVLLDSYSVADAPISGNGELQVDLQQNDLLAVYTRTSFSGDACRFDFSLAANAADARSLLASRTESAVDQFRARLRETAADNGLRLGPPGARLTQDSRQGVGSSREFWIYDFNTGSNSRALITATLRAAGVRCNVYMDDASPVQLTAAQLLQLVNAWDSAIYANVTAIFGVPTDVDGNGRVNLLFSPRLGQFSGGSYIGGYFDSTDLYSRAQRQYSNECELLYLNTLLITQNQQDIRLAFNVLPHELQHLINFRFRLGQDWVSVDEGLSGLAESLAGYGLNNGAAGYQLLYKVREYQLAPEKYPAMTSEYQQFVLGHYGSAYLFMQYLLDRFGDGIIGSMLAYGGMITPETMQAITGVSMTTLLRDWGTANLLDGMQTNPRYNYRTIAMRGSNNGQYYAPLFGVTIYSLRAAARPTALYNWSVAYYHAPQALQCTVSPRSASPPISGLVFRGQ